MIRVLIVEDSAVVTEYLKFIISTDPDLELIGSVSNGKQAVDFIKETRPDIVTMDIDMPVMGGLEATKVIMSTTPVPILIVTASRNAKEVKVSLDSLKAGALAVIEKPVGLGHPDGEKIARSFLKTVKVMATAKVVRRYGNNHDSPVSKKQLSPTGKIDMESPGYYQIVVVGVSSGGPQTLIKSFSKISTNFPYPIVVVQHISPGFLKGLVDWLNDAFNIPVNIASENEFLKPGNIYFAPDAKQMGVLKNGRVSLADCENSRGLCPSVSYLFNSVAGEFGSRAIAMILTGMGSDGAKGLKDLYDKGALTIAQDEGSSLIYGMPSAAVKHGGVKYVLSNEEISVFLYEIEKLSLNR